MTILKRKEQETKESNLKKHQGYVHTILDGFVTARGARIIYTHRTRHS